MQLYVGNTSPSLTDSLTANGAALNLTDCTVKLRMQLVGASELTVDADATVVDATEGEVRYDWQAADVDTAGAYIAWWHVVLPTDAVQDTDDFRIDIVQHGYSANLCSVNDVRMQAEWLPSDTSLDPKIDELIAQASKQIMTWANREFAPAQSALTRRFRVGPNLRANLVPYDLREVTSAVLFPDASTPRTLMATEYDLRPVNTPTGTYGWLHVSPLVPLWDSQVTTFGHTTVEIVGDWGFAYVPDDVRRAAVITVQSWLRRGDPKLLGTAAAQQLGYTQGSLQPSPQGTYSLPYAAQDALKPYRRFVGLV